MIPEFIFERFKEKFTIDTETDCWLWTASKTRMGYGQFRWDGKMRRAHRVAYEWVKGPIPEHLELDHLCRNRDCVNPDHLEAVTHQVNVARGNSGDHNKGMTHCPKGHPYSGENLYIVPKTLGRVCKACNRFLARELQRKKRKEQENDTRIYI